MLIYRWVVIDCTSVKMSFICDTMRSKLAFRASVVRVLMCKKSYVMYINKLYMYMMYLVHESVHVRLGFHPFFQGLLLWLYCTVCI